IPGRRDRSDRRRALPEPRDRPDERLQDERVRGARRRATVRARGGFTNVIVMIPFCRTLEEADRTLQALADNGRERHENGLEVYVMCEIPSNVILAEQFAERFDGFSIGGNAL